MEAMNLPEAIREAERQGYRFMGTLAGPAPLSEQARKDWSEFDGTKWRIEGNDLVEDWRPARSIIEIETAKEAGLTKETAVFRSSWPLT